MSVLHSRKVYLWRLVQVNVIYNQPRNLQFTNCMIVGICTRVNVAQQSLWNPILLFSPIGSMPRSLSHLGVYQYLSQTRQISPQSVQQRAVKVYYKRIYTHFDYTVQSMSCLNLRTRWESRTWWKCCRGAWSRSCSTRHVVRSCSRSECRSGKCPGRSFQFRIVSLLFDGSLPVRWGVRLHSRRGLRSVQSTLPPSVRSDTALQTSRSKYRPRLYFHWKFSQLVLLSNHASRFFIWQLYNFVILFWDKCHQHDLLLSFHKQCNNFLNVAASVQGCGKKPNIIRDWYDREEE